MEYRIIEADIISITDRIVRVDDDGSEWYIPSDEANSDYQAYLKSLEPEVAEELVEEEVAEVPDEENIVEIPIEEVTGE